MIGGHAHLTIWNSSESHAAMRSLKRSLVLQVVLILCIRHDRVKSTHETAVQYACEVLGSDRSTAPTNIPWEFGLIFRSCHCAEWINECLQSYFHLFEIFLWPRSQNLIIVGEDVGGKEKVKHKETQFTRWGEWHGKQNNGENELEERKRWDVRERFLQNIRIIINLFTSLLGEVLLHIITTAPAACDDL